MRFEAVIFDFNGTLLQDDDENQQSWLQYLYSQLNQHIPDSEYRDNIQGRSNTKILLEYLSEDLTKEEIEKHSEGKERLYRQMLIDRGDRLKLTEGSYNLFDYLDYQRIPYTIATGAPTPNVDFYFETFELRRWFDRDDVLVDTGDFAGKPDPEIYLRAMKQLESTPEKTLVIEDSAAGILAAERAGIKHIILMDTSKNRNEKYPVFDNFDEVIQYLIDLEK
ncbi:MAG TPA: HAD family phosphatase [Erysipelothrix sp.]|nr:HAD family phosphatase [Erysipelothrix sp.]